MNKAILPLMLALPLCAQSLQEQADNMSLPAPAANAERLQLPTVPQADVRLLGADYATLLTKDGSIKLLQEPVPVQVSFTVTRGKEQVTSRDYTITLPAAGNKAAEGGNPKPQVIPELLAWRGGKERYTLPEPLIVCDTLPDFVCRELAAATGRHIERAAATDARCHLTCGLYKNGTAFGKEGYRLHISPKGIHLSAESPAGIFYATRTLLQMLAQDKNTLPCGTAEDVPRFRLRGFVFDVGRLPVPMSFLKEVVDTMAWYKMNDLHLHLNDNYIFHEDYVKEGKDPMKESYAAFRMESKVKGLTAADTFYTKKEFAALVEYAAERGVAVVPEFDTPGHALSFTRVRPDLIYQGPMPRHADRRCEMLDAANPATLKFVGSVWDEYLRPRGAFTGCSAVHVGADEFFGDNEDYRRYLDGLLAHIQQHGYTPRVWGSLHIKQGNTPVRAEGVQMNIWSKDWGRAWESINQGYSIINTFDRDLYCVPTADYYRMDKNLPALWQNWLPNRMAGDTIPAGHPQLLGASWALWNDMIGPRHNGYTYKDLRSIIAPVCGTLSQKMWGKATPPCSYEEHRKTAESIGGPVR